MSALLSAADKRPRPWSARVVLWLLALCLVLSPALGRVHQVVHGGALDKALHALVAHAHGVALVQATHGHGGRAGAAAAAHAQGDAPGPGGVLQSLFHSHAGSDCDLLDQLLFGMALLPVPVLALAPSAEPAPQAPPAPGIGARPQRAFLARAPPGSRRA